MSRKIKMYILKYDLLKLELEEIEEKIKNVERDWYASFGEYFAKESTQFQEENKTHDLEITTENPPKIKKLYKKLAIKLHPDKSGDKKKFSNLKKIYDENNLIELIKLSNNYKIKYEYDEEDESLFEKNCKDLEEKIKFNLNSAVYQYYYGNSKQKQAVINLLKTKFNITFL